VANKTHREAVLNPKNPTGPGANKCPRLQLMRASFSSPSAPLLSKRFRVPEETKGLREPEYAPRSGVDSQGQYAKYKKNCQ
jgi:hypothetical protein